MKKKLRKWICMLTVCAVTAACVFHCAEVICYAYEETMGTVIDGPVQMRKAPVDGAKITSLATGTAVRIINETAGSDGYTWYEVQISYAGKPYTGYIRSDYISPGTAGDSTEDVQGGTDAGTEGVVSNTSGNVYVRTGAGTSYSPVTMVTKGQQVAVLGQAQTNGVVWYNITFVKDGSEYAGWICGTYLTVLGQTLPQDGSQGAMTPADEEYVASLKEAGFLDSYCNALLALHQKYPNWKFVPVRTGLDWNTVIENESVVGRNLVQSSANDARKSTAPGAYDWAANKWYGYDGDGWVSASKEYIAYCMDPRNYLNESYIFQFETLEYADYQNAAGVANLLSGSFMSGNYNDTDGVTRSYADTFMETGAGFGISPYHLAARCRQEQGAKGTSQLISGTYSGYNGYYNYFNIGAYTTSQASATVNGLNYAKNAGWNSIYKSINGGADVVSRNYVKKGQNTLYFQKFNVVNKNSLYTHQYMTNVQAAMAEGKTMGKAYADKAQAFVFLIPVYENMPESAAAFSDSGNPNNWLSSLDAEGYSLTPSFRGDTTEYTVIVGAQTDSVTVNAAAAAPKSSVSGTGAYTLNYGNNTVHITCMSQSGAARTYTLNVVRQQPSSGSGQPAEEGQIMVADGASVSTPYRVETYMSGIAPETSAANMLANITANNCTVKLLRADGADNNGIVGTGNKVTVYVNQTAVKQYETVIYGDINGDGKISVVDIVMMQKHILGTSRLSGAAAEAADTSKDGQVTIKDLVILQKHILHVSEISQ